MNDLRIELETLDCAVEILWDSDREVWEQLVFDAANKSSASLDTPEWSDVYHKDLKHAAIGDAIENASWLARERGRVSGL